ncbi:hypothetical protein [Mucilaginibacter sp. OK098]|uniref:hypothetical protein n=1 Tax=Mucilaginibacter sp. OK098 TaxID=1855297 RepID=UPI00116111EC|nr:hypothetical protein [Mucilaginibacter sp. OK098]
MVILTVEMVVGVFFMGGGGKKSAGKCDSPLESYRVPTSFYKTPAGFNIGRKMSKNIFCAVGTTPIPPFGWLKKIRGKIVQ